MPTLSELRGRMSAAIDAWRGYESASTSPIGETRDQRYSAYWSLYDGTAFLMLAGRRRGVFRDQRVYRNTRLLYSHAPIVGDFYGAHTYMGALPTDGDRLPDGSRGAIPIDPQAGSDEKNDALRKAIAQWWTRCNWQDQMSIRPTYVSILGDGLTELVDDPDRHGVWPQFVWPGYVTAITLDRVSNVQAYTLEYQVERVTERGKERYKFGKEVTKDTFSYFRDGQPWPDHSEGGHGDAVQENPYGFVPAVWDRYKKSPHGPWGISAIASTRQALYEMVSYFSHGIDYQRKGFGAPVIIKGSMGSGGGTGVVGPSRTTDPAALAEEIAFREVAPTGGIEMLQFDIGDALETIAGIKANILEMNPEADFYHQLREMTSLTGPGAQRALGDAVGRTNLFRNGMDINTNKLDQMAVAISGWRLNRGDWENPTARDEVFRPFSLESYAAGDLDCVILPRDVIPETMDERIRNLASIEALQSDWALGEIGIDENDIARIKADVQAASQIGEFGV